MHRLSPDRSRKRWWTGRFHPARRRRRPPRRTGPGGRRAARPGGGSTSDDDRPRGQPPDDPERLQEAGEPPGALQPVPAGAGPEGFEQIGGRRRLTELRPHRFERLDQPGRGPRLGGGVAGGPQLAREVQQRAGATSVILGVGDERERDQRRLNRRGRSSSSRTTPSPSPLSWPSTTSFRRTSGLVVQ